MLRLFGAGAELPQATEHLNMVNSAWQFYVRIRAKDLAEGRHYFAQIKAYDLDDPLK